MTTKLEKITEKIRTRTIKPLIDLSASMRKELFELLLDRDKMLEDSKQKNIDEKKAQALLIELTQASWQMGFYWSDDTPGGTYKEAKERYHKAIVEIKHRLTNSGDPSL